MICDLNATVCEVVAKKFSHLDDDFSGLVDAFGRHGGEDLP